MDVCLIEVPFHAGDGRHDPRWQKLVNDAFNLLATYGEARPWLALHEWLANGGTLIVAGDSQYTLLTEPRLRTLLPVEVLGLQQVAGLPALTR